MRILITGASGGLGQTLVSMLLDHSDCIVGSHGASKNIESSNENLIPITKKIENEEDCRSIVDTFCEKAGGIDALILLNGAIHFPGHWKDMPEADWQRDIDVNLNHHFFLARQAMEKMVSQGSGGRIVFNSTESAIHGGSALSFPYAIAKRGTECMVQGFAREGAPSNILVNAVRLGYFTSGFHKRWINKGPEQLEERAGLVPLKRGGDPAESAALFVYLLSGWSRFISGQVFAITGGDWL